MDYMALLSGGAPRDEFDIESREIETKLPSGVTAEETANVMADVFNRAFDANDAPEKFLRTSRAIAEELSVYDRFNVLEKSTLPIEWR